MSTILRAGEITRPVDLAHLLARNGQSLREAHDILQRLAAGERVAIEFEAGKTVKLRAELAEFGVSARVIAVPINRRITLR
jgi:hypothetical protein